MQPKTAPLRACWRLENAYSGHERKSLSEPQRLPGNAPVRRLGCMRNEATTQNLRQRSLTPSASSARALAGAEETSGDHNETAYRR